MRKVLLIGWDAADWKVINPLMDAGKMPNLQRLVERGSMAQIATLHPPLSPMLWTSIATGKRPFKHGIHGFSEPTPDGRDIQPVSNLSRRTKAVWNILNQNGLRSTVIGWWPSHPAEPLNGVMVSNHYQRASGPLEKGWPLLKDAVHPAELAETLAELRFHPNELAPEMVEAFVPKASEIDQNKDRRLASVMKILCECASIHSAATWLLDNRPWDFFAVYHDAIDHFCHGFMKYHPPRQKQISERDFELYQGVVSAAYRFHDIMLGTLLAKAGEGTTVMLTSDHGFHPDHLRPRSIPKNPAGPAIEHRDFGVFVMAGEGIKRDELLHGVSVLDLCPTVLALYGLPVGADMDGKVLNAAFTTDALTTSIPSWDEVPGDDGCHPPHTRLDPLAAREALEQLVALGYIARPDENREKAVADCITEQRYNLGESYHDADRHADAVEIFRELHSADPDEQRFAVHLFSSCQALGLAGEMRAIVDDLDGRRRALFEAARKSIAGLAEVARQRLAQRKAAEGAPAPANKREPLLDEGERKDLSRWRNLVRFQPPVVDYLKAQILTQERRWGEALDALDRVTDASMVRPGLFLQTAVLYAKMQQFEDAERVYRKALEIDPDNPHAHVGMCRMALRRRDYAAAAQSALDGIHRLYHYPTAHFLLGMALAGLNRDRNAADAFRVALSLNPNFPQAHLRLAMLLRRRLDDQAGAEEHLRIFRELRRQRRAAPVAAPVEPKAEEPELAGEPQPQLRRALPPVNGEVVIVSGLPRSGTSMIMQMLAAGGIPILTDGQRQPDEDNPLGYFEFEPAKSLHQKSDWMVDAKGRAVKIVAPLIPAVPSGLTCRLIFIERNLDEILNSQGQMLIRRGEKVEDTPARRGRLKEEYSRLLQRVRAGLQLRPQTETLFLGCEAVLNDPSAAAAAINQFLGGNLNEGAMAGAVKPSLHRQRR